jgi:hypothetical protein
MFLPEEAPQVYSGWYSVPVKSVGWLGDSTDPVPQGECPTAFLEFLDKAPLVNRYRGFHFCGLCGDRSNAPDDNVTRAGNGEYWVKTSNGEHYVLPAMVAHYIQHHGYCPPVNLVNNFAKVLSEEEVTALDRPPTPEELKIYRAMKRWRNPVIRMSWIT